MYKLLSFDRNLIEKTFINEMNSADVLIRKFLKRKSIIFNTFTPQWKFTILTGCIGHVTIFSQLKCRILEERILRLKIYL